MMRFQDNNNGTVTDVEDKDCIVSLRMSFSKDFYVSAKNKNQAIRKAKKEADEDEDNNVYDRRTWEWNPDGDYDVISACKDKQEKSDVMA